MIRVWKKRDGCWMNIGSPGFGPEQRLRGSLVIRELGLLNLKGVKKNGLRLLWTGPSRALRQEEAIGAGFVLWGGTNISGGGSATSTMQKEWKGKGGETRVVVGQSLLHKAIRVFCWPEMPVNDHLGCSEGIKIRLAYREGTGQAIHDGTAAEAKEGKTGDHRDRRAGDQKGTRVSNNGQRFGERITDLVWGKGPLRRKPRRFLSMAWGRAMWENQVGSDGYVEGFRELDAEEYSASGHSLRQIPCNEASWGSVG